MPVTTPTLPSGLRIYAIGDIHGRLDLLQSLMHKIQLDAESYAGKVQRIFLGDYIDRGPFSKGVIDYLLALRANPGNRDIFLTGNHEYTMRETLRTEDPERLADWLQFGGRETLLSYGLRLPMMPIKGSAIIAEILDAIPAAHTGFLEALQFSAASGDYFFAHAGVRPGVPLEQQTKDDLIWIRKEFLTHKKPFGKIVVHGHTISEEAQLLPNRIGIDTGAYATGCLTALGLEGSKQWLIQTP